MELKNTSDENVSSDIVLSGMKISNDSLLDIVDMVKDFAFSKGICMRRNDLTSDERVIIPFCLVPSTFPEEWFYHAKSIQRDLNYVLHKISHCPEFLKACFESILETDEFISKIFHIYDTVSKEGYSQPLSLGLFRSDYMLATDLSGTVTGIKQIENNTISTSFCGLSNSVLQLHKFVLDKLGLKNLQQKLPENESNIFMAKGIVCAWEAYGNENAVVLFVVEDLVTNICDQRAMEFAMYQVESQIQVIRYSFLELREKALLKDNCLFVNGEEVAVVYYRTGYVPAQYESKDWDLRLLMERSRAIKCPTAGYHLAGTKTVQLHLQLPGVLRRFLPENSDSENVLNVFARQFSLKNGPEGDKAVALALQNPHKYVLKPEREGGGFNVFGDNIKKLLESIGSTESRQSYILMEKVVPPLVRNCIVRASYHPEINNVSCELGIYGVILGEKDKIHYNYEAGHIIRSKNSDSDEGGIVAGFGALDSPLLN